MASGIRAAGRSPLRERLRRETATLHLRLEGRLDLLALTAERYQRMLRAYLGFYAPVEAKLARLAPTAPPLGVPLPTRSTLLVRDLGALGLSPGQIEAVPPCTRIPRLTSPEHLAGCLYVLEGASLGGRIIARELQRNLALDASNGASFFAGAAADAGARWPRVLEWLEEVGSTRRPDEIVAAACDTFRTFGAWLERNGALR